MARATKDTARKRPVRKGSDAPMLTPAQEAERRDTVTPAKVLARIRGWLLADMKRLELKHVSEEGTTRVRHWRVSDEENTNADVLAYEITKTAEEDAEGLGGFQRYAVYAYESNEPGGQHAARVLFEIRSDGEAGEDVGPTENANAKGLTSQLMRHLEAKDRMIANMFADTVGIQHQTIQALHQRLDGYEASRYEQFELTEKLVSADHARKLAAMKEERMAALQERGLNAALNYLPVIMARLTGANKNAPKALPAKAAPGAAQLKALFDGMGQERLAMLANVLGMSRLSLVGEISNALANESADAGGTEGLIRAFFNTLDEPTMMAIQKVLSAEEWASLCTVIGMYAEKERAAE